LARHHGMKQRPTNEWNAVAAVRQRYYVTCCRRLTCISLSLDEWRRISVTESHR